MFSPVRGATAARCRSPVLGAKAFFQLWESAKLELPPLEISQAAAGVGVRAVPGAVPCNHLSREDPSELAAGKTLALQPWSAAQLAHCAGDRAALPVIRRTAIAAYVAAGFPTPNTSGAPVGTLALARSNHQLQPSTRVAAAAPHELPHESRGSAAIAKRPK